MLNIFTYWEGKRPLYIEKLLGSFDKVDTHNCKFTLITPENIESVIDTSKLHVNWRHLTRIAHKADCLRVATILQYGGLWVDADTLYIKCPCAFIEKMSENQDFLYMKWNDGRILNGYFWGRRGSPILKAWLDKINSRLQLDDKNYSWTEFGEQCIMPLVYYWYGDRCKEIKRYHFLPVNIDKIPHVFFERIKLDGFLFDDTFTVGLNHSWFIDNYKAFTEIADIKKLSDGELLINDIMRQCND